MNFFIDHDVYAVTVNFLRTLGHDVVTASERGMSGSSDSDLLKFAQFESRVFVTRDRDFGNLVFVDRLGTGVVYLRIPPSTLQAVHLELERVLSLYSEVILLASFVVVEPGRHRVRRANRGGSLRVW